jgi:dihydrofolate reductase
MRKIITTTFITLDGVLQAPGGPEEDPTNGFTWGGWSFHYWDEFMNKVMFEAMQQPFDLLLGRRTYDIFAAHWPYIKDDIIADKFNSTRKYMVSHQSIKPTWNNTTVINDVTGIKALKEEEGHDLWVHGSGNLIQTLMANHLIDAMYVWTFPLTMGKGKRLFAEGTQPGALKLVDAKTSTTGVNISIYEPAGQVKTGSFVPEKPSDAELERRKRLAMEK